MMAMWMNYSLVMSVFTCCMCPGTLCGAFGGAFYTCRCCLPKREGAGRKASTVIYVTALFAIFFDFISAIALISASAYYEAVPCDFSASICSFRTLFQLGFVTIAILLIVIQINLKILNKKIDTCDLCFKSICNYERLLL